MLGDFYFGDVFPEQYTGTLFYGDFIRGWLRTADVSDPGNVTSAAFATDMLPMTEMRTGEDGALYYASITTGEIRRIRYTGDGSGQEGGGGTASQNVRVGAISYAFALLMSVVLLRRRTPKLSKFVGWARTSW